MASQTDTRNDIPVLGRPRTRFPGDKRYRIELGVGPTAKEALDRWRLFVNTWECTSPAELLHKAMDSLLTQARCGYEDSRSRSSSAHNKPLTMDVGCQYRLLDTVATPTVLCRPHPPAPPPPMSSSHEVCSEQKDLDSQVDNLQGVRKRSRCRKKPIGVGTISENTKRILLEHIPEVSERRSESKTGSVPDDARSFTTPLHPPTSSVLSLPSSSLHPPPTNSTSPAVAAVSASPSCLAVLPFNSRSHSQAFDTEEGTVKVNVGGAVALQQPGLIAFSRPVFGHLKSEEQLASLVPITAISFATQDSGYCEGRHETLDDVGTTPTSRSDQRGMLMVEPVKCLTEDGEHQIEVAGNDDSKVDSGNETDVIEGGGEGGLKEDEVGVCDGSSRKKGKNSNESLCRRLGGKWRNTRETSRKKKTKGLGGSISETTRRMLLEYTSSDRRAANTRDSRAGQTAGVASPDSGRSQESSTPGHQSVVFSGSTISESTKRILLEYYS